MKSKTMRRIEVKAAVYTRMFCECGKILDQRSAVLFQTKVRNYAGILCPSCACKTCEELPDDLQFTTLTWESETKHGEDSAR